MREGDVVFAKSIPVCFENSIVRGTSTWKAAKGHVIAFLALGTCKEGEMNGFDAVGALIAHGWTPPAHLARAKEGAGS